MKEYTDVATFGCSFAYAIGCSHSNIHEDGPFVDKKTKKITCYNNHWPKIDECFGSIVSAGLGTNRHIEARMGGSNHYIIRKVFEWCRHNKNKWNSSLLLIGISESQRYEYHDEFGWHQEKPLDTDGLGYFKHEMPDEVQWLSVVQGIIGLQSFLKLNNIDHVFFDSMTPLKKQKPKNDTLGGTELFDNFVLYDDWYIHPKYESFWYTIKENPSLGAPCTHPNVDGHKFWGESLLEYIHKMIKV